MKGVVRPAGGAGPVAETGGSEDAIVCTVQFAALEIDQAIELVVWPVELARRGVEQVLYIEPVGIAVVA